MDTKGLARLYSRLTPRERLPLLVAANGRSDQAEADQAGSLADFGGSAFPAALLCRKPKIATQIKKPRERTQHCVLFPRFGGRAPRDHPLRRGHSVKMRMLSAYPMTVDVILWLLSSPPLVRPLSPGSRS
jgi:hypothetical protein